MSLCSRCLVLIAFLLSSPGAQAQTPTTLAAGWNLIGNGSTASLDVADATLFGDPGKVVTVWKWVLASSKWAFYAPSMTSQGLSDYAVSKGYDVLATINAGEGFWVNATTPFSVSLPNTPAVLAAFFQSGLLSGWSLIAIGETKSPSEFNRLLTTTALTPGTEPLNVTTLWAWDSTQSAWYFFAPSLSNSGGLAAYIQSKGYLDFTAASKNLAQGMGFWVNKPDTATATTTTAAATTTTTAAAAATTTTTTAVATTTTTTVNVAPGSQPPVAYPGRSQYADAGDLVILDGSQSVDPAGGVLTYAWSQTQGTPVALADASAQTLYIDAPAPAGGAEELVFNLMVTNTIGLSGTASVKIYLGIPAPTPPPSTISLIDAAVLAGSITAEKGLTYKVFALFGDSRLPAPYRGTSGGMVEGTGIMAEVSSSYETMSDEAKTDVYPFLLPAYVNGSWNELGTVRQVTNTTGNRLGSALLPAASVWKSIGTGKVRVWYEDITVTSKAGNVAANEADLAKTILTEVENTIWPSLSALMDPALPISDAGKKPPSLPPNYGTIPANFNPDGALDIVLARGVDISAWTIAYDKLPGAVFITIAVDLWPLGDETNPGLIQVVAHELMHAFQYSYPVKEAWDTYAWLREATAVWAEDYVYPKADSENRYVEVSPATFVQTMHYPIDSRKYDREYGAYMPFSFWTNGVNGTNASAPPSMVRNVWENAASMDSLRAVDEAYPPPGTTGLPRKFRAMFERFWADALVAIWNQGYGYFAKKDTLIGVGAYARNKKIVNVKLGGLSQKEYNLNALDPDGKIELPYLSARYYHFAFTDDAVRTVMFYDGLSSKLTLFKAPDGTLSYLRERFAVDLTNPLKDPAEGIQVRLIVKIDGQKWKEWKPPQADTTGVVSFSRDAKAERLQELVILVANSSIDTTFVVKPTPFPASAPILLVSNINTWGWDGTFTSTHESSSAGDPREVSSATAKFRRAQDLYPALFPAALTPIGTFLVKSGNYTWSISGQYNGCTTAGSDAWSWNAGPFAEGSGGASIFPEALPGGGRYRKYSGVGTGGGGHLSPYTITCPKETPPITNGEKAPTWWQPAKSGELAASNISADGTLMSGNSIVDGTLYEWTLKAAREP